MVTASSSTEHTRDELISAGFTTGQADGAMMHMRQSLKSAAFAPADLRAHGFSPQQLLDAGFEPDVVRDAGFDSSDLQLLLADKSLPPEVLRLSGLSPVDMHKAGASLPELKAAGFTAGQVRKECRLTLAELRECGFGAAEFKSAGFSPAELLEAGFALAALREAGFTLTMLSKKAGLSAEQLVDAGFSPRALFDAGVMSVEELASCAAFTKQQISAASFTKDERRGAAPSGAPAAPPAPLGRAPTQPSALHAAPASTSTAAAGGTTRAAGGSSATAVLELWQQKGSCSFPPVGSPAAGAFKGNDGVGGERHVRMQGEPWAAKSAPIPRLVSLLNSPPAKQVVGPSGRIYGPSRSFLCLAPGHWPRRPAILLVESSAFEAVVLTMIGINVLMMAADSPVDEPGTPKAAALAMSEEVFLCAYTFEMIVRMLAYGVICHQGAYLRDPWYQLDFLVVSLALLPRLLNVPLSNYSAFRCFRALRALRALKRMPGMPKLVQSIFEVLPKMGDVAMLCAFIFLVFGIVGIELFKGTLHYRCATDGFVETPGHPGTSERVLGRAGARGLAPASEQSPFDTGVACNPQRSDQCDAGESCMYFDSAPGSGLMSFDHIGVTFVVLLREVTLDDWATPMYAIERAVSGWATLYFLLIVVVGGFFVMNLFLAVIFEEFLELKMVETAVTAATDDDLSTPRKDTPAAFDLQPAPPPAIKGGQLRVHVQTPDGGGEAATASLLEQGRTRSDGAQPVGCLRAVATSARLGHTATALVVLNLVLMTLPYEGMPEVYTQRLELVTQSLTIMFIIEMCVKLLGLGCREYWDDQWNALDGMVTSMSLVGLIVTDLMAVVDTPNMAFLRILRILRLVRLLRLLRAWKGLHRVIVSFGIALAQIANLLVLMLVIMVIAALVGMQLLGGKYDEANGFSTVPCPGGVCPDPTLEELPHYHFNYFLPAMSTVLCIMTGEWIDPLGPAAAAVGPSAAVYFITVVLIGRYLVFNLFLGMLLDAFAVGSDDDSKSEGSSMSPLMLRRSSTRGNLSPLRRSPTMAQGSFRRSSPTFTAPAMVGMDDELPQLADPSLEWRWPHDYSLAIFSPSNPIRRSCVALMSLPSFDALVMVFIVASCVCLGLDSPRLDPAAPLAITLGLLDTVWTIIFTLEMVIKVIALGFVFGDGAYLRSTSNQLDALIVFSSLGALVAEALGASDGANLLRQLKLLRALRPLRLIQRNAGMRTIVTSLFKALPMVSNVFFIVVALQAVFAILGMQLYSGKLASCTDPTVPVREQCMEAARRQLKGGNGNGGHEKGVETIRWVNPRFGSFDDFGSGMLLLFIMASGDEWETPMYSLMGAVAPGVAPMRDDFNLPGFIFSVAWMFVGAFFGLNLFAGVIVDTFDQIKKETDQSATMTPEQQQWVNAMSAVMKQKPTKGVHTPSNPCLRVLFRFVTSATFESAIMGVIIANVGVMACDYWGIERDERNYALYTNALLGFGYIYYCEAALKIVSLGPSGYFSDGWCRFDFLLVALTLLDQIGSDLLPVPPTFLRVMRVVRILRILRILKGAKQLRTLVVTLLLSFPALINVAGLLLVAVFIYAVLGLNLFAFLPAGDLISAQQNFETLPNAALLLFQVLTGDAWSAMMADAMVDEGSGLCSTEEGNCGSSAAIIYFVSFLMLSTFVLLNLVVAVILENFSALGQHDPNLVTAADVEEFKEAWAAFDPDADNFMLASDLPDLVLRLTPPLGLSGLRSDPQVARKHAVKMCMKLKITQHGGAVGFQDVLNALTRYNFTKNGVNADEMNASVEVHVPAAAPAALLVPRLPDDLALKRSADSDSAFVDSMPSVRRVFAIDLIRKAASAKKVRDQTKKDLLACAASAPAAPAPAAGSTPASAPAADSKRAPVSGKRTVKNAKGKYDKESLPLSADEKSRPPSPQAIGRTAGWTGLAKTSPPPAAALPPPKPVSKPKLKMAAVGKPKRPSSSKPAAPSLPQVAESDRPGSLFAVRTKQAAQNESPEVADSDRPAPGFSGFMARNIKAAAPSLPLTVAESDRQGRSNTRSKSQPPSSWRPSSLSASPPKIRGPLPDQAITVTSHRGGRVGPTRPSFSRGQ